MLAHGGVLEQFIGDGAMVVFGVPSPGPKDAAAALAAALDLLADIRKRNAELQAKGEQPFRVSVGIHCGPVVVARLGGPTQAQMSTSGDTVNVASRLEKLTRDHGAAIAISGAVVEAVKSAGRDDLLQGFERVATQTVRGRAGQLAIWVKKEPGP
jgi:adenylate cyclase